MDKKDTYLIVAAVVICILISCLSPFIASPDPDGLEKSNLDVSNVTGQGEDFTVENISIPSVFPDYADGQSEIVQIAVLILGALMTLALGYVLAIVIKNR